MIAQRSIGSEAAIALAETKWWLEKDAKEVLEFQLTTDELCLPFSELHRISELALGRSVFTHEFGSMGRLLEELRGDRAPATFEEILNLIPEEKRIVIEIVE